MGLLDLFRPRGAAADYDALVYRGPATLPGCPEAVAAVLTQFGLRPAYVGPREAVSLTRENLAKAAVYAQPGGGELDEAWEHMSRYSDTIRDYVSEGGAYLGFCLGAYLAGRSPGFKLFQGDTDQYVTSKKASVKHEGDAVMTISWRGQNRQVYFQDGPYFDLKKKSTAEVLAAYDNGLPAALVGELGAGRVGLCGPHPEATSDWFTDAGLRPPDPATDLALDLVSAVVTR